MFRPRDVPAVLTIVVAAMALLACNSEPPVASRTAEDAASVAPPRVPEANADVEPAPVTARLLSDVEIIQPGTTFRLGVLLVPEPGWHIIVDDGDAEGRSTEVRLRLPHDFVPEPPPVFPTEALVLPDGRRAQGYSGEALIYSRVRASNLDPDRDWRLAADVSWTACAQECRSGETSVDLTLPASISGTRLQNFRNIQLFDEWADRATERPAR